MSKKRYDENGRRIYTEKDINILLNNSETALRVRMFRRLRKIVSVVIVFYGVVFALLAAYFCFRATLNRSGEDPYACVKEPQTPVVGYIYGEGGKVVGKKYDDTDFGLSTDEESLVSRLESVDVSLLELSFAQDEVNSFFENHEKASHEKSLVGALLLRFRVLLKSGEVIELALPRYGNRIICTRAHGDVVIPVSSIECFRRALSGNEYKDDVLTDLRRRGMGNIPRGAVAEHALECMTDEEARKLLYLMAVEAEETQFDWGCVLRICTFGVWNKYHPIQSCLTTLVLLLIFLVVRKKVSK